MITHCGIEANPDKIQAVLDMKPSQNVREVHRLTGCIVALGRFMSRSADKCKPLFHASGTILIGMSRRTRLSRL